ncbi:hypothetical protein HPP92_027707 [Vanilla planifolia]|uniref:Uncharacterized protein n=1 Tax=Vanilla planifolia TaxID=51239 RepID=A0A835PBW2_VANPL|nr:hypothetical protein HPP92_027707 [Vanilla planifolia]
MVRSLDNLLTMDLESIMVDAAIDSNGEDDAFIKKGIFTYLTWFMLSGPHCRGMLSKDY